MEPLDSSKRVEDITARTMFYSGEPVLNSIFTAPPWKIFAISSLAACVLLLIPAWFLNLHSIPTSQGNLGFFYSYHWSVMYSVVIPLLLSMAVAVSDRMKTCVVTLETNGRISPRPGQENVGSYSRALSEYLRKRAKPLVIFALAISILATVVDTHNLWIGYLPGYLPPPSRKPEWDTAFNAINWGASYNNAEFLAYVPYRPSKPANLFFDTVAYLFQTAALFFAFFWVGKFTMLLAAFARFIGDRDPFFKFDPLTTDLDLRMGLKPMGRLFDSFLAITVLIEAYAFYHRLHLIKLHNNQPLHAYVLTTLKNIVLPPESKSVPYPFTHFTELVKPESWAVNALDVSGLLTIVLMTIPIIVVCFLPLWRIRKLVDERREQEIKRLQDEYSDALATKNFDRVQLVEHEKRCLERTNIWPNGDARANRYLRLILALAAGAIAPPLLAIVVAASVSEGLAKYFRLIFHRGGD